MHSHLSIVEPPRFEFMIGELGSPVYGNHYLLVFYLALALDDQVHVWVQRDHQVPLFNLDLMDG